MKKNSQKLVSFMLALVLVVCVLPPFAVSAAAEFSTEPMIAAGMAHIVALNSNGTVWAWGNNMVGQLGNGTGGTGDWGEFSDTPVQVQGLTNVIAVAAGSSSSAALRSDGTVWAWGNVDGYATTVPVQIQGFANITAIAAGAGHMLALRNDGTVWARGSNHSGQIGDGTSSRWDSAGFVDNDRLTPVQVPGINNAVYISAGASTSVAVLSDGTVFRWGSYGLDENNFVVYAASPTLSHGHNNVVAFASVNSSENLSLRSDGTVWSGLDSPAPVQGVGSATAVATSMTGLSGGNFQAMSAALRSDGTVLQWSSSGFWDRDGYEQFFVETSSAPSQVQGLYNITAIVAAGSNVEAVISSYVAALRDDGTVFVWGGRAPGVTGDWEAQWYQPTPVAVPGPGGVGTLNLQAAPSQPPVEQPPTQPSVPNNHSSWAGPELQRAAEQNLIPATLQPAHVDLTQPITRAEFAGVVVLTFENLARIPALPTIVNPFTDTSDPYVLRAFNTGLMVGVSDTQFDPNTPLNREQTATALTRAFKRATIPSWTFATDANYPLNFTWPALFADDASISDWARESVYFMAANEIILGTGNNMFSPRATTTEQQARGYAVATREQALIIALRMVENLR